MYSFQSSLFTIHGMYQSQSEVTKAIPITFDTRLKTALYNSFRPNNLNSLLNCIRAVFIRVSKVIRELLWFCFSTLCDWFKKLMPPTQPIRCKTNHVTWSHAFSHAWPMRIYFEFSLVHFVVYVCCDWPLWLLWAWFCDTRLKTTPSIARTDYDLRCKLI